MTPRLVQFLATLECNVSCLYCYQSLQRNSIAPRLHVLNAIGRRIVDLRPDEVLLMGGEVFLLSNVEDLVDAWVTAGIRVAVVTNGTLRRRIAAFVERFPDVTLNLSVDGLGPTSTAQRGYDAFRAVEGLLARCDPRFNLILTVVDQEVGEIVALLEHTVADAARRIFVNLDNRGTMADSPFGEQVRRAVRPTPQRLGGGLLDELLKSKNAAKIISTVDRRFVSNGGVRCGNAADGAIRIGPEGNAYLCESLTRQCGNILADSPESILARLRDYEARLRECTLA